MPPRASAAQTQRGTLMIETVAEEAGGSNADWPPTDIDHIRRNLVAGPEHAPDGDVSELHELHVARLARPFPTEGLPPTIRNLVEDVASSTRTPTAYAGSCSLGMLSAAIGKGLRVKSLPGLLATANLYILVGVPSGHGKSITYGPIAAPLTEFEHGSGLIKSGSMNVSRLTCEDTTTEALAPLLEANGECISSMSSDGRDVLETLMGRYRDRCRTDEGLYLKCWSLEPHTVDRIKRDRPVRLREPAMTVLWLVQPDKITKLYGHPQLADSGLLPRFLPCQVVCEPQRIDRSRPGVDSKLAEDWKQLVWALLRRYRLSGEALIMDASPEAITLLDQYHEEVRRRRLGDCADVDSYAARWAEQAWRLSVVLHAALHGDRAHEIPISSHTADGAIAITRWFAEEQLTLLSAGGNDRRSRAEKAVLTLLAQQPKGVIAADVYRRRIVGSAKEAHALLEAMAAAGKLICSHSQPLGGGHVTRLYLGASRLVQDV